MKIIPLLQKELDQEAKITRKFLKLVPVDKFDWKPHEKSMSMRQLSTHIAELPNFISTSIETDGIDLASNPYKPTPVENSSDLLAVFEKSLEKAKAALDDTTADVLDKTFTVRSGDQIFLSMPKYEAVRHGFNQTTHHRAQLGVYLRLLNIPIPGSYGPSADESNPS